MIGRSTPSLEGGHKLDKGGLGGTPAQDVADPRRVVLFAVHPLAPRKRHLGRAPAKEKSSLKCWVGPIKPRNCYIFC